MEETVRMVQSAAQAGVEITAELLKLLAPALARGGIKILGAGGKLIGFGIDKATNAIIDAKAEGTVSRKHLFAEAAREKSEVKCTNCFPTDVTEKIVEKAKENHIPISVNGEGANRSISYLERDKDVVAQIMQEWQAERLAPKENIQGQSVTSFAIRDEQNVDAIKSQFEQNGVECWFTQNQNGNIRCNFKSADAEKAEIVIEDFKKTQSEITERCKINSVNSGNSEKEAVISDGKKSVTINVDNNLRKSDVSGILREELGYTPVQAELAANKLADELGLGDDYFTPPSQMNNIDKMQVNIRYGSDDISIQDISFSAVKLSDGDVRVNVTNGDNSVLVIPTELSDEELKTVFTERCGMSEIQAEKAVAKVRKIDAQIQNKHRETVFQHDTQRAVNIERTSRNAFIVKADEKTKSYEFGQINLEEKIASDFGIPAKNAHNVVQKAQGQSVIQNRIRQNSEKKRKSDKLKNDPLTHNTNTSARKVKR